MAEIVYRASASGVGLNTLIDEIHEATRFRYVVYSYVRSNLMLRYRRSILGFAWSVLAPMMQYLVIGVIFKITSKAQDPDFFTYFFTASVLFQWFSAVAVKAPLIMIENEHYIKKIYVPKLIFVLNTICLEGVNFFASLTVLLFLGAASGYLHVTLNWFLLPLVLLGSLGFMAGMACFLSVASVFFRDFTHMIPVLMQSLFFVTPILYPVSTVPERFKFVLFLNPLYYFIDVFRSILMGKEVAFENLGAGLGIGLVVLILGSLFLKKYENRIVFKL